MQNLNELTDRELYEKCSFFGTQARKWANKFAALLPEVEKRALYKKYGFYSIFEFAAKLAGMRHKTVIEILRVAKKLEDKPLLRDQLDTHGWGKLKVVATFATKENEKMLSEKVREMSKSALVTFLQEIRKESAEIVKKRTGSPESLPSRIHVRLLLKPKTELRLKELQKKMSRKIGAPVDLNEVMEALLDAYDKREAPKSARKANTQIVNAPTASDIGTPSRYIPVAIKKVLYSKYGGRCAFPGCNKLPDIYHHTRRFSLHPNHNPDFLMPLCHAHEQLAHHGLIENEERPAENWRLQLEQDKSAAKYWVDRRVRGFRAKLFY